MRSREYTNGPNFNVRCERPVTRVLYAIENGGFSGAIMPQNVVVGQDAIKVAEFVATYCRAPGDGSPRRNPVRDPTDRSDPVTDRDHRHDHDDAKARAKAHSPRKEEEEAPVGRARHQTDPQRP